MSSVPLMSTVATRFPNGSTPSTWPRVIGYGGGVNAGQKSSGLSVVGQVRSARSPPEFVMAKSVLNVVRIASVTMLPSSDSQSRPSTRPQESDRGTTRLDEPIVRARIGRNAVLSASIRAWMAGSGVTPAFHGLWKSDVR